MQKTFLSEYIFNKVHTHINIIMTIISHTFMTISGNGIKFQLHKPIELVGDVGDGCGDSVGCGGVSTQISLAVITNVE